MAEQQENSKLDKVLLDIKSKNENLSHLANNLNRVTIKLSGFNVYESPTPVEIKDTPDRSLVEDLYTNLQLQETIIQDLYSLVENLNANV